MSERFTPYRCRWCGRKVAGVYGWFHNPDTCPCGARVRVETVTPDFNGWEGVCEAGHRVFLTDLFSPPRILEDA